VKKWVAGVLADAELVAAIDRFVGTIARDGFVTSLSQKLVTLTAPGVPDVYQGTELWDLSLVDPDNRRPVDFDLRARLLAEVGSLSPEAILARMDEGLPKLWVTRQALAVRAERPDAFGSDGGYETLEVSGERPEHLIAFARGGGAVVTLAPRLVRGLAGSFGDTTVAVPGGAYRNVLDGSETSGGKVRVADVLARFPLALLVRRD
jgi:(1->4)-alpha-D-glucan 1-alpha-D-glucosylmutase